MRKLKLTGLFLTVAVLMAFCVTASGHKLTVTKVTTKVSTFTFTQQTKTICFSLVSEGGEGPTPCRRRRRQFWIEDPIFVKPYHNDYHSQFLIQPTHVFQLETTTPPMLEFRNDPFSEVDDGYANDLVSSHSPQPSLWMPITDFKPRIYYKAGGKVPMGGFRMGNRKTRSESTVTFTRTRTVTETEMSTKTNTIAISGCTPSPLLFDVCPP